VVEIKATIKSEASATESVIPERFGQEPEASESSATGSGFEVDDEGTIVTAAHVVDEATAVQVILQDGTTRSAEVLGVDDASDIAVIRFDPEGAELHPLDLADSSELKVGASVAAIGAPFEYAWSFSTGIVSGLDRTIEAPNGFTVPSDLVAAELQQLEAGESVEHAYLGVATATSAEAVDGAQVAEVAQGSPAAEAGVKRGDVITELDGEAVGDSEDLVAAIAEHQPGDAVTLEVKRGSDSTALKVTLGAQPAGSGLG
jgi:putative serine protease PepD